MASIIPRSNTKLKELDLVYECMQKANKDIAEAVKFAMKNYEARVHKAEQKRKDAEKHADDKIKMLVEKLDDQKEKVQELKLQLKEAKEISNQLKTQIIKLKNESRSPKAAPSKDPSKWRRDSAHSEDKHAIGRNIGSNSAKPRRKRQDDHDQSSEEHQGRDQSPDSHERCRGREKNAYIIRRVTPVDLVVATAVIHEVSAEERQSQQQKGIAIR